MKLSVSSASDLSVSLTHSELEEDLPEGVAHPDIIPSAGVTPERSDSPGESDNHGRESSSLSEPRSRPQLNNDPIPQAAATERYVQPLT